MWGKKKDGQAYPKKQKKGKPMTEAHGTTVPRLGVELIKSHQLIKGKVNAGNLTDNIVKYEMGTLSLEDTLELFSYLINSNLAWQLQGSYGRTALDLIDNGIIKGDGTILKSADDLREKMQ